MKSKTARSHGYSHYEVEEERRRGKLDNEMGGHKNGFFIRWDINR